MSSIDFVQTEQSPDWLKDRIILLGIVGSRAHGTDTEESDTDYRGVCVPPKDFYFGFNSFTDYDSTGGKNWKTKKGEIDFCIMHVTKFVYQCMKGHPQALELLFLRPEEYVVLTEWGKELLAVRNMFLSKVIGPTFQGCAHSEWGKFLARTADGNINYKAAAHVIRLLEKACIYLETGSFEAYCENADHILEIKQGKFTPNILHGNYTKLDIRLGKLILGPVAVPTTADYNKINQWLIDFNERAYKVEKFMD